MGFDAIFASLATSFSAKFGGPYADAAARWPGVPTLDDGGSITTPGTPVEIACRAQIDLATEAMRQAPDFLQTDVRLLVLGVDALDTAATVDVAGRGTYALLTVTRDPAGIGWECRARRQL